MDIAFSKITVLVMTLVVFSVGCSTDTPTLSSFAPLATAEIIPSPSLSSDDSSSSSEVYFPKPSSDLFIIEPPYSALFDAIIDYYWQDCPNSFILPTFSVWGSYSLDNHQEVYILNVTLWSFCEYSVPNKSIEYGTLQPRFKIVLEQCDVDYRAVYTEEIYDSSLRDECKYIPSLYESLINSEPIKPIWSFIPLKEILTQYRTELSVEINHVVDWGGNLISIDKFGT